MNMDKKNNVTFFLYLADKTCLAIRMLDDINKEQDKILQGSVTDVPDDNLNELLELVHREIMTLSTFKEITNDALEVFDRCTQKEKTSITNKLNITQGEILGYLEETSNKINKQTHIVLQKAACILEERFNRSHR